MKTIDLMFDGEAVECFVETKADGEIVCHTKDGRFLKFPPDTDLKAAAKIHNAANDRVPVSAEDADKQADELAEWKKSK